MRMHTRTSFKGYDEVSEFLTRWRGARAEPWEYLCSHGQFLLRFSRREPDWNPARGIYVHCKDCVTVSFDSYAWDDSDVQLARAPDPLGELLTLSDGGRLRITCHYIFAYEMDTRFTLFEALP